MAASPKASICKLYRFSVKGKGQTQTQTLNPRGVVTSIACEMLRSGRVDAVLCEGSASLEASP